MDVIKQELVLSNYKGGRYIVAIPKMPTIGTEAEEMMPPPSLQLIYIYDRRTDEHTFYYRYFDWEVV